MQLILSKDNANRAENEINIFISYPEMQLILSKDNANRIQCKTNLFDFVLLRCSLSYPKIMQIERKTK